MILGKGWKEQQQQQQQQQQERWWEADVPSRLQKA